MSLDECYAAIGGDLEGVRARMPSDEMIEKFCRLFTEDSSFESLVLAIDTGNLSEAFRAAHTLKGASGELGLTPLQEAASSLCEALRLDNSGVPVGSLCEVPAMRSRVEEAYAATMAALSEHLTAL